MVQLYRHVCSSDVLGSVGVITYSLGPDHGTLSVRTQRTGAAAMAGHNLLIHVTAWEATVERGDDTGAAVDVYGSALRVQEGSGAMQALGDEDKENIRQPID